LILVDPGRGTAKGAQVPQDNDHAAAMREKMKGRVPGPGGVELKDPNIESGQMLSPYSRISTLDRDVREVVDVIGTVNSPARTRGTLMDVEARVGSHKG